MTPPLDLDELVERFTLLPDELALLRNKTGATRLGFATLLKHLIWKGQFPRGPSDLPDEAVEFVARQVKVPAADIAFYDWDGRQIKAHRRELRETLGWRPCSVADAEKLTDWLAEHVCTGERRANQVRLELLTRCRREQIEPPALMLIAGLAAAAYSTSAVLRLRTEETANLAEPVLSAATGRIRWALSHISVAVGGACLLLIAAGLSAGLGYGVLTGSVRTQLPRLLGADVATERPAPLASPQGAFLAVQAVPDLPSVH